MAIRESGARYVYGLSRTRLRAVNDDLTTPTFDNVIGGAGPFDGSAMSVAAAVPISLKVNGLTVVSDTLDLSGVVSAGAITAQEWVTAFTASSISGWTASLQAVTGRVKLVNSTSGAYVQVYGEAARLAMIGQGKGLKAIKSDTIQTFNNSPTVKEDTTQTTTDANGKDTEVIVEGYKKGWTGSIVDTAEDYEMMELVESGIISTDGKTYTDPDSGTKKVQFEIETYNPIYTSGTNTENQIAGWEHKHFKSVKGSRGDESNQAGFGVMNYNLVGTNYKTTAGVESGGIVRDQLATTAWSTAIFDAI